MFKDRDCYNPLKTVQTAPKRVNLIVYSQRFIANIYVPYGGSFTDVDGYSPLKVVQIAPKHVAVIIL
jgi:hypothetical protein